MEYKQDSNIESPYSELEKVITLNIKAEHVMAMTKSLKLCEFYKFSKMFLEHLEKYHPAEIQALERKRKLTRQENEMELKQS